MIWSTEKLQRCTRTGAAAFAAVLCISLFLNPVIWRAWQDLNLRPLVPENNSGAYSVLTQQNNIRFLGTSTAYVCRLSRRVSYPPTTEKLQRRFV